MKTTSIKIIGLMIIMTAILSSCNGVNPELRCNTGTQGVTATFSRDTMRTSYDENVEYPLVIDIENKGAYSTQVYLQISHNRDIVSIEPPHIVTERPVEGKEHWNECRGTMSKELFTITPRRMLAAVEEFRTDIALNLCYEYKTDLNTTLCVHNNISRINVVTDNCRYGDKSFGGGQGSPLSFIRAEAPTYLPNDDNKVRIRLYLRNYGQGRIVASDTEGLESACRSETGIYNDFVRIESAYLDQYEMDCSLLPFTTGPSDHTHLRADHQRTVQNNVEIILRDYYIECQTIQGVDLTSPREMSLNIRMAYYYKDLAVHRRSINIRKV
ncbi:MAG: hypothetical protein ACMXYL_02990 [Candidatus Woesearchaeota archaeon]